MASHSLEVADSVTDGVHSHMAHVQSPRWVWKHGEDIKLLPVGTLGKTTITITTITLDFNPERLQ